MACRDNEQTSGGLTPSTIRQAAIYVNMRPEHILQSAMTSGLLFLDHVERFHTLWPEEYLPTPLVLLYMKELLSEFHDEDERTARHRQPDSVHKTTSSLMLAATQFLATVENLYRSPGNRSFPVPYVVRRMIGKLQPKEKRMKEAGEEGGPTLTPTRREEGVGDRRTPSPPKPPPETHLATANCHSLSGDDLLFVRMAGELLNHLERLDDEKRLRDTTTTQPPPGPAPFLMNHIGHLLSVLWHETHETDAPADRQHCESGGPSQEVKSAFAEAARHFLDSLIFAQPYKRVNMLPFPLVRRHINRLLVDSFSKMGCKKIALQIQLEKQQQEERPARKQSSGGSNDSTGPKRLGRKRKCSARKRKCSARCPLCGRIWC